ncbi:hypothetical protein AAFF_G00171530 [Aldrovandia affinis]|uniref:IRF tryptophan pentad repeat domain-containing protein n=1 Tax=Aldrovandia affinis TaxID=143900 RepID=A0AAD7WVU9_9TELE|nr:hypothetical protein AAFF_G00171530 [Aldrovandia affinis]
MTPGGDINACHSSDSVNRFQGMSLQPGRNRLKPWPIAQVNSRKYRGLQWLGFHQKLFRIPWHHATCRQSTPEEGNTIFKQVRFPSVAEIPKEKQCFYYTVMDQGLILEIQGQDIRVVR